MEQRTRVLLIIASVSYDTELHWFEKNLQYFCIFMQCLAQLLGINFKKELQAYAEGGAIADEAISSVRTVTSLGCQKKFVDR